MTARARDTDRAAGTAPQTVPWIVADFEFEGHEFLVVLWPEGEKDGERWQVYQADFPWYWKSQPHEDRRV